MCHSTNASYFSTFDTAKCGSIRMLFSYIHTYSDIPSTAPALNIDRSLVPATYLCRSIVLYVTRRSDVLFSALNSVHPYLTVKWSWRSDLVASWRFRLGSKLAVRLDRILSLLSSAALWVTTLFVASVISEWWLFINWQGRRLSVTCTAARHWIGPWVRPSARVLR
jgi:hypothetical protein